MNAIEVHGSPGDQLGHGETRARPGEVRGLLRVLALVLALFWLGQVQAATFVVTSAADTGGATCSTTCTLRQAIGAANLTAAADTINFAIPFPPSGEISIQTASLLPTIEQPLTINGYSQSGASPNTLATGSNANVRIRLDRGAIVGVARGLSTCANSVVIKGLSITGFDVGISFGTSSSGIVCPSPSTGSIASGNFVGLRSDGITAAGNDTGIIASAAQVTVGGATAADRNLISAQANRGVAFFREGVAGSSVTNNLVGTDRSGLLDRGNGDAGVLVATDVENLTIGNSAQPNVLAFNQFGISTFSNSLAGNRWFANSIHDSDALGIDIGGDGVTPNDANDTDTGANGLQNFPILTGVARDPNGLAVSGQMDIGGVPGSKKTLTLAFYASATCDASGHGEGERFLGAIEREFTSVTNETFTLVLATSDPLPPGVQITATATAPDGSSSEFSPCLGPDPPALVVNSAADTTDGTCDVANCTLREAITAANASDNPDQIHFAIASPASGEILIALNSRLPTIVQPVTIDGYTQAGTSVNTLDTLSNAVLRIRIDGSGFNGFDVCASGVTISGLSITGMTAGISVGRDTFLVQCPSPVSGATVVGNFIGLRADGITGDGNTVGISVIRSAVTIGGETLADRNVIAANAQQGIGISTAGCTGTRVLNNLIGTNKSATQAFNAAVGMVIGQAASGCVVGTESAPNDVRNGTVGIKVESGMSNTLFANRIRDSIGLGIDLGGATGVTPNDADDADTGPNQLQNFPVVDAAVRAAGGIRVTGLLDVPVAASNAPYTIAVYASSQCDESGFGEGERFLGSKTVNLTQTSGESFDFVLATSDALEPGTQITTTATDPSGNTSEFSACIAATDPPPGFVVTSSADTDGSTCGATCTLRQAINAANTAAGTDTIRFEIPGTGPFSINVTNPLPAITEALTIDGYTQLGASPNTLTGPGSDAVILIRIDGGGSVDSALALCASNVTVRGLSLTRSAGRGIRKQAGCATPVTGLSIRGNSLGIPPNGVASVFSGDGIDLTGATATIGGELPADRNLFGPSLSGIILRTGTAGTTILGNTFGIDGAGTGSAGIGCAILLDTGTTGAVIGSESAPNLFRFNNTGICASGTASGNRFHANEFADHQVLAVDLIAGSPGVSGNDIDDTDAGPNNLQNFPVLSAAVSGSPGFTVNGLLDVPAATSNQSYTLAFYENVACDSTGHGEGEIYLGSVVKTFSANAETFSVSLPITPPAVGRVITATATDPQGNTSEFSQCLAVTVGDGVFGDGFE